MPSQFTKSGAFCIRGAECQLAVFAALLAACVCSFGHAADESAPGEEAPLNWQRGPCEAQIGDHATIQVPEGYQFVGEQETQELLQWMGNPTDGSELGMLVPSTEEDEWFIVFEFSDVGYVSDDDREELDSDALLDALRQGTERSNAERLRRGWPTMQIVGWEREPNYDAQTNNLEWAVRAESEGEPIVNFNTRLLGREGVMEVNLVVDPDKLAATLPEYKSLLGGYSYVPGKRYAEFRAGDKIARYGLAGLVTGGAAAVALKVGLFKKLWKVIVVAFIAVAAFFKKLFFGRHAEAEA
jgi:uncharacterized membrane-anchored protein